MRTTSLLALLLCMLVACQKTPPQTNPTPIPDPTPISEMDSTNFGNKEIAFGQTFSADLNHDGTKDFLVYTMLVGDADLQRAYKRFLIGTNDDSADLPINQNEEAPVLFRDQIIFQNVFYGYEWCEMIRVIAAQKVTTTDRSWWEGIWSDKLNRYLPLRIHKNGKIYYGWIELSFDSTKEKLIIHRAAVSKRADTAVKAGN